MLTMIPLVACVATETPDSTDAAVDVRRDFPAPPEGGMQWVSPEYVIPPYSEVQMCSFDTYTGPTVGVSAQWTYQSEGGHHVVLTSTTSSEREFPDGTVFDCTEADDLPMTDLEPLFVGGVIGSEENDYIGELVLPDGMASQLKEGTRIVLQSHYINTTDEPILVQDAINAAVVEPDQVETWAAPFVHVITEHPIPAGGVFDRQFECAWEDDYEVLFLGGHMHEWGQSFYTDMTTADGKTERIYEVAEWDALMRDAPPYIDFEPGEFSVKAGDSFTTSCTWNNDTSRVLDFPEEMCVTFGMVYPAKVPVVCSP